MGAVPIPSDAPLLVADRPLSARRYSNQVNKDALKSLTAVLGVGGATFR